MRERFFSCIDALVKADTKDCIPGFSIMALCCLLIETLQGFRGIQVSLAAPAEPCSFPSGPCIKPPSGTNQKLITFLRRPAFGGAFNDAIAKSFAKGIRNGILHDAETRKWLIWRDKPAGKIVERKENGYALNRSRFYEAVKKEFESYLQELRDPTKGDLRKSFKKKMNKLCKET